jgi:cytochrome b
MLKALRKHGQFFTGPGARILVWDAPLRVAHAAFIACVAGAWLTRDATELDVHAVFGYGALIAVAFRLAWGFAGSAHARFASFAYSPGAAWRYLQDALAGRARHYTGHNPAGSWAVFGLLLLLFCVIASGLVATGAMHAMGPFGDAIPWSWGRPAWRWHEALAWALLALVALHVAGVAWGSRVHRENLAAAMVTGRKVAHGSEIAVAQRGALAIGLVAAIGLFAAYFLALHAPGEIETREAHEARGSRALGQTAWGAECGSCHLAYAPALLPARSWRRTLAEQDRHFGEDLGLDDASRARLLAEASAAPAAAWGAWVLASSIAPEEAPLRISELPFWKELHGGLPGDAFEPPVHGRHDCEACHRDAGSGIFHPRMIHIPKRKVGS